MATDDTEETTKEQPSPRARTARRPLEEADEPVPDDRARPRPGRRPEEEEPEPLITPGSFSRTLGHVALALLAVAVLYTAWQHSRRDNGDDNGNGNGEPRTEAEEENRVPEGEPEVTATTTGRGEPQAARCPPDDGPSEPVRSFAGPPPLCIDPNRSYVATVQTTRGEFEITLDPTVARRAVNNFVFLARWRFYEGSSFHRIDPGFLMDTGDPIAPLDPQRGGPGYSIEVEPPPTGERPYPVMSVTTVVNGDGTTHGSQFSIVTGAAAESSSELSPSLRPTVFGHVTSGEDVVRAIDATGDELMGRPQEGAATIIQRITIDEQ